MHGVRSVSRSNQIELSMSKSTNSEISMYLLGASTALIVVVLFFLLWFFYMRPASSSLSDMYGPLNLQTENKKSWKEMTYVDLIYLPDRIKDKLAEINASFGYAHNPTNAKRHESVLTERAGKILKSKLRKNVDIDAYQVKSLLPYNVTPPVIYLSSDIKIPAEVNKYLESQTRTRYHISTDGEGNRKTVPQINSDKNLLVIGDSVAFGIGADDDEHFSSRLQFYLGNTVSVTTVGVGGYQYQQIKHKLKSALKQKKYDGIIYIFCLNDFWSFLDGEDWSSKKNTEVSLRDLKDFFNLLKKQADGKPVMIILVEYMEHLIPSFFLENGWSAERITYMETIRDLAIDLCERKGFSLIDWGEIVDDVSESDGSFYAKIGLYFDHIHMSPRGYDLLAERAAKILPKNLGLNLKVISRP